MRIVSKNAQQPGFLPGAALIVAFALILCQPLKVSGAEPPLRVVTTTATLGVFAASVGGDQVDVRVLAPPDRDPHYLEARPSFMAALRRADLLIEMGADLEEGWLPVVQRGAGNPKILTGNSGHLRAADPLHLRPSITMEGPNLGHVHAEGNPHFHIHPGLMRRVLFDVAQRLSELRPTHEQQFRHQARTLARDLDTHVEALITQVTPGTLMLTYHEDLDYLAEWLPVKDVGHLEPLPGIPPTARHLQRLVAELSDQPSGVVLHAIYQPGQGAEFIKERLGWRTASVRMEPPVDGDFDDYLELLSELASAVSH